MKIQAESSIQSQVDQSTVQRVWSQSKMAISRAKRKLTNGCIVAHDLHKVRESLARLPVAQDVFALATCRLNNAQNYFGRGAFGPANYELRLLSGIVNREAECLTDQRMVTLRY